MEDAQILAKKQIGVGVRNTAITSSTNALIHGLRTAIESLKEGRNVSFALAAGMITSDLGLHEVRHVRCPAGIEELGGGIQRRQFSDFGDLPFFFLPGVRSGLLPASLEDFDATDVMRGEETEIMGALNLFALNGPLLYVHLGSHTKFVQIDEFNRIVRGSSTLGGELMYSIQQQTILRSSLPETQDIPFDASMFMRGWENADRFGFTRALYQVRVLDIASVCSKEKIHSFYMGSILREEFRCLAFFNQGVQLRSVVLSGLPHLHSAWNYAFEQLRISPRCLSSEETEQAFLRGLFLIYSSQTTNSH